MTRRLALIARGCLLGMTWGLVVGASYGKPWSEGVLTGLVLWGPVTFAAVPGPHTPRIAATRT